ncbi:NAD(P)H-binding protein [Candidatus Pantoea floridensis]|uniref:Nucleoside-diphosphate-sugar epimerase n=1 Tax=Candidatus Pantoea floridensis TaxID=1938870 RepID=A0A286DNT4_9GAMM|nr:NAD(P)H-binding protein [Pantoea floridensis]PIF15114.1 nucleoside-diphosphate-sugar epimerase [Enterobacteriaceae bacterium JKS000233]SOD60358.1 Nucleoside-diphosphate-sugar epimerase [Pantoea floridensis]
MSKVFIIGGAGNIGRRLSSLLATQGHIARPLFRKAEQEQPLRERGAEPVNGDLTRLDSAALAALMAGSDVVVFTAGAGGKGGEEMTNAIDGEGLKTAVAATQQAGIKRFLLVSAFPEAGRGKNLSANFENYMRVKKMADVALAQSQLDWVIVRPGTLTDEQGSGKVNAGLAIPYGDIPREDVAATLAEIIDRPDLNRIIIELTSGEVAIREAVGHLAKD